MTPSTYKKSLTENVKMERNAFTSNNRGRSATFFIDAAGGGFTITEDGKMIAEYDMPDADKKKFFEWAQKVGTREGWIK